MKEWWRSGGGFQTFIHSSKKEKSPKERGGDEERACERETEDVGGGVGVGRTLSGIINVVHFTFTTLWAPWKGKARY